MNKDGVLNKTISDGKISVSSIPLKGPLLIFWDLYT